jgi:hypothetical protein
VLEVTANGGSTILSSEQINNSVFIEPNRWTNISMTLNISNFYSAVEFKGWLAKGNWTVSLKGVSVAQISPPIRGQKFYDLLKLVNLIPQNSTVLAENNLPAPIPQILTLNSYNLIMPDQINTTKPQYAIANSPRWWFTEFYGSGKYGILAEVYGVVLLEKSYNGSPVYYVPYNAYFDHNSFAFGSNFWYGPYTGLAPGIYNITYQLKSSNTSKSNAIVLEVTANGGSTILSSEQINNSVFIR